MILNTLPSLVDPTAGRNPVIAIMRRCDLHKYYVPLRAESKKATYRSMGR